MFGSVAATVLRGLGKPLVLTGPAVLRPVSADRPRRMVVCLDGSTTAATILPVAHRWAKALALELLLLHVQHPPDDPYLDLDVNRAVVAEVGRSAAAFAKAGIRADRSVVQDIDAATGILRRSAHWSADLVALATHGRTGLQRSLVGSVTLDLVRAAHVPLLVLRPQPLVGPSSGG